MIWYAVHWKLKSILGILRKNYNFWGKFVPFWEEIFPQPRSRLASVHNIKLGCVSSPADDYISLLKGRETVCALSPIHLQSPVHTVTSPPPVSCSPGFYICSQGFTFTFGCHQQPHMCTKQLILFLSRESRDSDCVHTTWPSQCVHQCVLHKPTHAPTCLLPTCAAHYHCWWYYWRGGAGIVPPSHSFFSFFFKVREGGDQCS